jgi:hypothetical protein
MYCRNCGQELEGTPEVCVGCGAKPLTGNSFCPSCGAPITPASEVCPSCGRGLDQKTSTGSGNDNLPLAGGIIAIAIGALAVLGGLGSLVSGGFEVAFGPDLFSGLSGGFDVVMGLGQILFGGMAITGGIFAVRKENYPLALAGGICAVFAGGGACCCIFLPIGAVALVLIAISKDRFDAKERGE